MDILDNEFISYCHNNTPTSASGVEYVGNEIYILKKNLRCRLIFEQCLVWHPQIEDDKDPGVGLFSSGLITKTDRRYETSMEDEDGEAREGPEMMACIPKGDDQGHIWVCVRYWQKYRKDG